MRASRRVQRKFDDMLIVDVDAHHYENENFGEILPFMENDVLRQLTLSGRAKGRRAASADAGRLIRTWAAASPAIRCAPSEKTEPGKLRDVQLGERWMDAMSVDYSCLFPTGMLNIGLHPQKEMEVELCWAYNRWLTEKVLPESRRPLLFDALPAVLRSGRSRCATSRPSATARASTGFMVTTVRTLPVHDNAYMKVYRAIEERGLSLVVPFRPELGRAGVPAPATASSRCTRSASPSTTSCTAPTGSSTAWASASPSCR